MLSVFIGGREVVDRLNDSNFQPTLDRCRRTVTKVDVAGFGESPVEFGNSAVWSEKAYHIW